MKIQLEINGIEDRRTVAAILVANGYTVRLAKVKDSRVKTVVEAEKRGRKEMIIDSPKAEKGKIFFSSKISSKKISVIYQSVADVLKLFEDRDVQINSVLICGYTNADEEIKIPKCFDVKIEFEEPEGGIDLFEIDRNVADIFKYRKVLEIYHEKEVDKK